MSPRPCNDGERNSSKESAKFSKRPSDIKQIQQQLQKKLLSIEDDCEEDNDVHVSREDPLDNVLLETEENCDTTALKDET